MGRESIEEGGGLLNDPLLPVKSSDGSSGDVDYHIISRDISNNKRGSSSSATTMVIFTTLVAVCGSYVFGSAVSMVFVLLLYNLSFSDF